METVGARSTKWAKMYLDQRPSKWLERTLIALPFIIFFGWYFVGAEVRHRENPHDKIQPTISQLANAFKRVALEKDKEEEIYRLWVDTGVTGRRFLICTALTIPAIFIGLYLGYMPLLEALLLRFTLMFGHLQMMALMPILFTLFGTDETFKILFVLFGVAPKLILETYDRVQEVLKEKSELVIKAETMAASGPEVVLCVIFPTILPGLFDQMRMTMSQIIQFLLIGETVAADSGWGYRMNVAQRNTSMDLLIVYAVFICLMAYLVDKSMKWARWKLFPWDRKKEASRK